WPSAWTPRHLVALAVAVALAVFHLLVEPVNLARSAASVARLGAAAEGAARTLAPDQAIGEQRVVIANVPSAVFPIYALFMRAAEGLPIPAQTLALASSVAPLQIARTDPHTLLLRYGGPQDFLFRPKGYPMAPGDEVRLTGASIRVMAVDRDGRPTEISARFDAPLEDRSLKWLEWSSSCNGGEFVPFTPPAVGQQITLGGAPSPGAAGSDRQCS